MVFPKAVTATPTEIVSVTVKLSEGELDESGSGKKANYLIRVRYNNGDIKNFNGDLVPYLNTADKTWLLDFIGRIRTKAENELL